jgi:glycine oxidase
VTAVVLGMGLAGAWAALELHRRGIDVKVYDNHSRRAASRVAAGLINPATGTRPKATWLGDTLLPFAEEAYNTAGNLLGCSPRTQRTIRRVFLTEKDKTLWGQAVDRGLDMPWKPLSESIDGIPLPFGGTEYSGATINTILFLDAFEMYAKDNALVLDAAPITEQFDLVVWCQGWSAAQDEMWSWLPFQPVKGEILDAEIAGIPLQAVYIRGAWVVPEIVKTASPNGMQRIRIGATHDWDDLTEDVSEGARTKLLEKAETLLQREIHVVGQQAAIRPSAQSKRPYIGLHPKNQKHAIINGLGSKGSLWAPWAARQLVDHVLDGTSLNDEVNIQRWWED